VDRELKDMIHRMFEIMYEGMGIGLAANQVDLPYRLFVMNVEGDPSAPELEHVLINPEITQRKGTAEAEEGCLSFPGIYAPVRRPEKVTVTAYTLDGREMAYELSGLPARAAQHEIDHLDGVVFIDRLSPSALLSVKQDLAELEQEFATDRRLGLIPDDDQIAQRLAELEEART
jgi:peptide deformylase